MSNDTTIQHAYFQGKKATHLHEFCHRDEGIALDDSDSKVRLAYMIISTKESQALNGEETDKPTILDTVANHYSAYLEDGIKQEAFAGGKPITLNMLKSSSEQIIKEKLIYIAQQSLYCGHSYGSVLKANEYNHAYNNVLPDQFKPKSNTQSIASLEYDKDKAQRLLNLEKRETKNKLKENEQAYIMLSLPFVYNVKKGSSAIIEELEVQYELSKLTASFMPELIVEYGVFFDGTNNNMYNIDFYRNFTQFLEEPAKYIEENIDKYFDPKSTDEYPSIQEYILSTPNPKYDEDVAKLLINQINKATPAIRYFDNESNLDISDQEILASTKAKHAKKVYDYLLNVKEGIKNSEEPTRANYIRDKILVEDAKDSSYTNGESNIARLYKLYDGDDIKNNKNALPTTRFKLYESGSGTHNPFVAENYKGDSIWGLGLAIGETGVKAHIIYACIKIGEQLREAKINHIDELILDVFGFSRGAASARHFINTILNNAQLIKNSRRDYTVKMNDEKDIFHPFFGDDGYIQISSKVFFNPLRNDVKEAKINDYITVKNKYYDENGSAIIIDTVSLRFAGIYDTVPHYGTNQADDSEDLNLDFFVNGNNNKIGQVVHLMAEDEYRHNFQTFSIFPEINKSFRHVKGHFEEFYLPGAHADVGGGYNASSETILLSSQLINNTKGTIAEIKNKIVNWNKKHKWIKDDTILIEEANNKKEIEEKQKDGFYYTIRKKVDHRNPTNNNAYMSIYMHKTHVYNNYEYVTLKLMYNRAVYENGNDEPQYDKSIKKPYERVPLSKPSSYSFSKDNVLNKVYDVLSEHQSLKQKDDNYYTQLKDSYLHHSSQVSFVNKPSKKDKNENDFYGKRVIYTSNGLEYTKS